MIPIRIHPVMWVFLMLTVLSNLIFVEEICVQSFCGFEIAFEGN